MKPSSKHFAKQSARALVTLLVLALPFIALRNATVRATLVRLLEQLRADGALGLVRFAGLEAVGGLVFMPIWLPGMMAGYVWGFPLGVPVATLGVALGGCAGFLAGRALSRWGFAVNLPGAYGEAVRRATGREGLKVVTLLRVTPVMPQNLLHYFLATTAVTLRQFALGTFLGLFPVTTVYVYLGSLIHSATTLVAGESRVGGPLRWAMPAAGGLATVVALVLIGRLGRRMLAETLAEAPATSSEGVTDNLTQPPRSP